jgi:CRISPR system Cascade subunit CasA
MDMFTHSFIATTSGKISLRTLLTGDVNYELQYFYDESQLAAVQLIASLATMLLKPSLRDLSLFLENGITSKQFDDALSNINLEDFSTDKFMQMPHLVNEKSLEAVVSKLVSGIESGGSSNANGLFSRPEDVSDVCEDCMHLLNYNLHMNIKAEPFAAGGATGIRGGGSISTLISATTLKNTIIFNMVAVDEFNAARGDIPDVSNEVMWVTPPTGAIYFAHHIGLYRGLFALAYRINYKIENSPCTCDVCGIESPRKVTKYNYQKFQGRYGSTKAGRDNGAGWWPHPYTPTNTSENGLFPVTATDESWQSWEHFSNYVVKTQLEKKLLEPAYIVGQYMKLDTGSPCALLVGGNITSQASIVGRIYDLYSMPAMVTKNLSKITKVIDEGIKIRDALSTALSRKPEGLDKSFFKPIRTDIMFKFTSTSQQLIQEVLQNVGRKESTELRLDASNKMKKLAYSLFADVMRRYGHDMRVFKALARGEIMLKKALKD